MIYIWEFISGAYAVREDKGTVYLCHNYNTLAKALIDKFNTDICKIYSHPESFTRKNYKALKEEI